MVFCPDCGKEVRNAKFCSNCGAELPHMAEEVKNTKFCSNCGSKIDADASVCPDCGFNFNNNVSVQNTPKSVFAAGLLSFIFPGFGSAVQWSDYKGNLFYYWMDCFSYSFFDINWLYFNAYCMGNVIN